MKEEYYLLYFLRPPERKEWRIDFWYGTGCGSIHDRFLCSLSFRTGGQITIEEIIEGLSFKVEHHHPQGMPEKYQMTKYILTEESAMAIKLKWE